MWNDANDEIEKLWSQFITRTCKYPSRCPVCGKISAHIYLHRYKENKGTAWMWCSDCKNCSHGTMDIPGWWHDDNFIELSKTGSHPEYLESKKTDIDNYINDMLGGVGMHKIKAVFNESTIRVYQAYNDAIADEALQKGTFGEKFSLDRMTWIKPSFLWMMYRSDWAEREGQNRILAIDMKRTGFDAIVDDAVLSSYHADVYGSRDKWKEALKQSDVRCQWDPERDIYGNPLPERTIQLGIRGKSAWNYVNKWIVSISDITDFVREMHLEREERGEGISSNLPIEVEYPKYAKS